MLKDFAVISVCTLLSRITGLLREILIARVFGVSNFTDAFNVAFRVPNLLRRLFAEGAFVQAFVPILGQFKANNGNIAAKELVQAMATVMAISLFCISLLGATCAPIIVTIMASGFSENQNSYLASVWMTRLMFPYIFFIALVAMASSVLNTWKKFAIPAVTPVLLNISMIGAAILLAPYFSIPIYALAFGVIFGGIMQLSLQLIALKKINMLPKLSLNFAQALRHNGVQRILKQMLPAIFAVSVAQLSLIINTNYATYLQAGSVSWLSYADRLMEFPSALLGVALGTILLPTLSQAYAAQDYQSYSNKLDWGLRLTLLMSLPAAVCLFVFNKPLVAVLFHYGRFSAFDVTMSSKALCAYGIGLIGLIMIKILAPGFYAQQDIRTPVKIAIKVLLLTQLMNLLLVPTLGHTGLALSIGLGACINALMLLRGLLNKKIYRPSPDWLNFLSKIVIASILLGIWLFWIANTFDWLMLAANPIYRIILCGFSLFVALVLYLGTLYFLGLQAKYFLRK